MGDRELKAMTAGLEAGENRDKWFFQAPFDL